MWDIHGVWVPALSPFLAPGSPRTATAPFYQGGPAEQGSTLEPAVLPVGPYLRRLATQTAPDSSGQVPPLVVPATLGDGTRGWALNWRFSLTPRDLYLAQWSILEAAPQLEGDLRVRSLWRSWWRLIYTHVFIGPAGTVTGLHTDWNPNFFGSVCGTKDWILWPSTQDEALQPSSKFDYGATCSQVNLSKLQAMPPDVKARFQGASGGLYVRLEAGDALYVPPYTWHAVISTTPAISLSIFGLQLRHVVVNGVPMVASWILHKMGLYRRGNCTCCLNRGAKSD